MVLLGFFIEWIEISCLAAPLLLPIFNHANTGHSGGVRASFDRAIEPPRWA
jgi:hypothetical protein